jgi:hypothetical protein
VIAFASEGVVKVWSGVVDDSFFMKVAGSEKPCKIRWLLSGFSPVPVIESMPKNISTSSQD